LKRTSMSSRELVHFDLEVVGRIAEYGLCIDCDFYNC